MPSLTDIFHTCLNHRAISIAGNTTHPSHSLFSLLPSGKLYQSLWACSTRLSNKFIHQVVRMFNSAHYLPHLPLPLDWNTPITHKDSISSFLENKPCIQSYNLQSVSHLTTKLAQLSMLISIQCYHIALLHLNKLSPRCTRVFFFHMHIYSKVRKKCLR